MNSAIIARTSDAYQPCIVVHPNGTTQRSNVMQGRMMDVATARADHAAGRLVWVATQQHQIAALVAYIRDHSEGDGEATERELYGE